MRLSPWIWLPIIVGLLFRISLLWQNYSLWLDEAYIADIAFSLTWSELWGELPYGQSCPIGSLALIKLGATLFPNEFGLRMFPFLAGALLAILAPLLTLRLTSNTRAAAYIGWITALSAPLVLYGGQAKQYEIEALSCLAVFWVSSLRRPAWAYMLLYPILVLLSFSAPLAIAGEILLRAYRERSLFLPAWGLPAFAGWIVVYFGQIRFFASRTDLAEFWEHGFPSGNPLIWSLQKTTELFNFPVGIQPAILGAIMFSVGWFSTPRSARNLVAAVLGGAILLALAGYYPLEGRLGLYLFFPLALVVAVALARLPLVLGGILCTIALYSDFTWTSRFSLQKSDNHFVRGNTALPVQDIRPLLETLNGKEEGIMVHPSALPQTRAYLHILGITTPILPWSDTAAGLVLSAAATSDPNLKIIVESGDCFLGYRPNAVLPATTQPPPKNPM